MTDRNFRRRTLSISYDAQSDVLWMANDKQAPRGFDIVKNRVIAFFDHDGTTPTAVMVFDAAELLSPFFHPPEGKVSESSLVVFGGPDNQTAEAAVDQFLNPETRKTDSLVVVHKSSTKETSFEKFLKVEDLDIYYDSDGDTLSLGNGRPASKGGRDIGEGLVIFFEEDSVPVHLELNPAAELLTPVLAEAAASKADRLIK